MSAPTQENGSRIHFRAVCGVGWVLSRHLSELREICDRQAKGMDYLGWIDLISKKLLETYPTAYAVSTVWIGDMQQELATLAHGASGREEPEVQAFLNRISQELSDPHASDLQFQLDTFNADAHRVAGEMLSNLKWSTPAVKELWEKTISLFAVYISHEHGAHSFYPVTEKSSQRIKLVVEPSAFDPTHALLSYLTLEFQFLHEYVSHALPVWINATQEEVLLLAATYEFYPCSLPSDGIRSFLADTLRQRRIDEFSVARNRASNFAAQMGREQFSRFLLSLSITDNEQLSKAEKSNLAAKIKMLPLANASLQRQCDVHLQAADPGIAEFRALREIIPSRRS
jgi:hypothetical protein